MKWPLICMLALLGACASTNENTEETKTTPSITGRWITDGNSGVAKYLAFKYDGIYYSWLKNQLKPSRPTGKYSITEDGFLQLKFSPDMEPIRFRFDSLSEQYMKLIPEQDAGNQTLTFIKLIE